MTNHTNTQRSVMVDPCTVTRIASDGADVICLDPPLDDAGPARPGLTMTRDAALNTALRIIHVLDPDPDGRSDA